VNERVAVITGGSSGLGFAVASVLAHRGDTVVIAARNNGRLESARRMMQEGLTSPVVAISADTTDQTQVDSLMSNVLGRCGRIDILINCAANPSGTAAAIEDVNTDVLLDDLNTKVVGYVRCVKAVAPSMKRQKYGRIVNIGGLTGRSSEMLSGLRNAAVSHLTKKLSDELGPFGITVNAVHPGIVRTPHLDELFDDEAAKQGLQSNEVEADFVARIPIRRVLDPAEIGSLVAFLTSDDAAGITGESIAIDGGISRGVYL
jgi:NAD(P)-dependent dehydrogenase (short-subunit alcohol dehydrogenase family)